MTDSWIRLCERVDALLNRVACQTALDTPADALKGAKSGLQELVKLLKVQPWPEIDGFARAVGRAASALKTAEGIADTLASVQADWVAYQHYLIGDVPVATESVAGSAVLSDSQR